jgi:hypothetical protein
MTQMALNDLVLDLTTPNSPATSNQNAHLSMLLLHCLLCRKSPSTVLFMNGVLLYYLFSRLSKHRPVSVANISLALKAWIWIRLLPLLRLASKVAENNGSQVKLGLK